MIYLLNCKLVSESNDTIDPDSYKWGYADGYSQRGMYPWDRTTSVYPTIDDDIYKEGYQDGEADFKRDSAAEVD